jgi:hypothetical protein
MTLVQLQTIVAESGAILRQLDWFMRWMPSKQLVDTIRSVESMERIARKQLHNHPDYSYEGL